MANADKLIASVLASAQSVHNPNASQLVSIKLEMLDTGDYHLTVAGPSNCMAIIFNPDDLDRMLVDFIAYRSATRKR